jgi:hypothetical protein
MSICAAPIPGVLLITVSLASLSTACVQFLWVTEMRPSVNSGTHFRVAYPGGR